MESRRSGAVVIGIAIAVALSLIAGVGTAPADEQFQLSVVGSIDVPDRDVTFDGDSYTVSAVGRTNPGTTVSITASGPENTSYAVYLYNNDEQVVDTRQVTGDGTVTFDTGELELDSGTYIVTINGPDGNTRAIHPLVVSGYTVDLTAPTDAEPGETITFQVNVSQIDSTAPDIRQVEVVIAQGDDDRTLTATETSDGVYTVEATLNTSGTYRVYAVVRGDDTVGDERELLGISDENEISVTTTTTTTTQSGGGGGGGSAATTTTRTTQSPQSTTVTSTTTQSPPSTTETTRSPTTTTASVAGGSATTRQSSTTTADDDVLTPASTTLPPTTTTGRLNGVQLLAGVLLAGALVLQAVRRQW